MLAKQAKTLSNAQVKTVLLHLDSSRNPIRNRLIFLLSTKAGLGAKEIAELTWRMVTDAQGEISHEIRLENSASKGLSGGVIAMNAELRPSLIEWRQQSWLLNARGRAIRTERSSETCAAVIVDLMRGWYLELGFEGCSSHSGRRTFVTNAGSQDFIGGRKPTGCPSVGSTLVAVNHPAVH